MKELFDLFVAFAKIGGLTFGGGYAMLPMLQREVVEARGWATENELMDYYAVGQCTPGVIAVNTAVFVGNKTRGIAGGIAAALGVVSPSLVIITLIAAFIESFSDLPIVQNAFSGIHVGVFVLILNSIIKLFKQAVIDIWTVILFLLVFVASMLVDISPIVFVVFAGVSGIVIKVVKEKYAK